ncbi:MAG: leucyl aminopeptidase [Candidatus Nanopelagicales bacterium]|jgi:leucyl aminopeptidase|nr:leucyl aminopeptidase [Candidatus Nanopelagicales bacterium]MDP4930957.1 leucyl aminopeptidase [Candidatus Nanopelagicaceae bacterium]HAG54239.1 leucyl aminopeptidase [Actinomycetota bacterium]MDP4652948.1 leucyl aminopeptidase [Candidatus Nanopelagicales bacterium]MDP4750869.1 leucyl aminopeptidase [Candidatus Nanopelagicales bacterium]
MPTTLPTISASDNSVIDEVLVLGFALDKKSKKFSILSGELRVDQGPLLQALTDLGASGASDEVIKLPGSASKLILLTALTLKSDGSIAHEVLRRAAGAAARSLAGTTSATFALPQASKQDFQAIAEGALLGAYTFDEFRGSSKADRKPALKKVTIYSKKAKDKSYLQGIKRAEIIAKYTHLTRDLINTPPSHLTPDSFSLRFKKLAASLGVKVEILNESQLIKGGYGGIIGVGQGSANPPRLLRLSYSGKGAKKRYAFIGKGITFDTGGLALKPAQGMEAMKSDMSGAAAVCAAVLAIAELKLPIHIDAWAALAENMVSDKATRPSDIITIYGGKTVEVLNPDAEGRLVLADAMVRAAEVGKKAGGLDGMVDVATLTGAQVVALGTRTSAVMTNNESFREQFLTLAEITGEAFWPMPLPEELRASLDSPVADMANIGDRMGGMLVAGLFLKDFVDSELPWLHLDIAGPAYNEAKAHGYTPVGGTGVALRTLVALAESSAAK